MKKILYLVLVAVLAAAVPAWGQNDQTYTLGKIPAGWTVKANGTTVTVTDSTAIIPAGATVVLTPTNTAKVKKVTLKDAPVCRRVDLSQITADSVIQDCDTLTGTLAANVKISIADGATVTLKDATINGTDNSDYQWAGITCLGNATIILEGTNTVKGFYNAYPGIYVPGEKNNPSNDKTLTIQGAGSLTASSNGWGSGIGGGYDIACGNIEIQGGNITATGQEDAAGIGCGWDGSCGAITISGGTVNAIGGSSNIGNGSGAAGIGSGNNASCGAITISGGTVNATGGIRAAGIGCGSVGDCGNITIIDGVTQVTATKGEYAPNSIGAAEYGSCGTVTIGGTIYYQNSDYVDEGAADYLTQSTIVYPAPVGPTYPIALSAVTDTAYVGSVITSIGNVYKTVSDATAANETAVAIIAYVGSAGSVETGTTYKGLAIALSDANGGSNCKWYTSQNVTCLPQPTSNEATACGYIDGITSTTTLTNGHSNHVHAAATAAVNNNNTAHPTGTSDWFLPSMGQWNLIVQGLATKKAGFPVTTKLTSGTNDTYKSSELNVVINKVGGTVFQNGVYWSSSEYSTTYTWAIDYRYGNVIYRKKADIPSYVRAVIAF